MSLSTWLARFLICTVRGRCGAAPAVSALPSGCLVLACFARWLLQCTVGLVALLLASAAWAWLGFGESWLARDLGLKAALLTLWVGVPLVLCICLLLLLADSVARAARRPALDVLAGLCSHQVTASALLLTLGFAVLAPSHPLSQVGASWRGAVHASALVHPPSVQRVRRVSAQDRVLPKRLLQGAAGEPGGGQPVAVWQVQP